MANVNSIRILLRRVEFSNSVAALITGDQGIDLVGELQFLDNERVMNILRVIWFPGGTDLNSNPNPDQNIFLKSEEILKFVVYYV